VLGEPLLRSETGEKSPSLFLIVEEGNIVRRGITGGRRGVVLDPLKKDEGVFRADIHKKGGLKYRESPQDVGERKHQFNQLMEHCLTPL